MLSPGFVDVPVKLAPVPPGLTPELKEPSLAWSTMVIAPVADGAVTREVDKRLKESLCIVVGGPIARSLWISC